MPKLPITRKDEMQFSLGLSFGGWSAGGKRRARFSYEELPTIAPPQNVQDILRALGQCFSEVHAGRLEPKVANACAYLASGILAAVTAGNFEARIAELEKRHEVMKGGVR